MLALIGDALAACRLCQPAVATAAQRRRSGEPDAVDLEREAVVYNWGERGR